MIKTLLPVKPESEKAHTPCSLPIRPEVSKMTRTNILRILTFAIVATGASHARADMCSVLFRREVDEKISRTLQADENQAAKPERRLKFLASGVVDIADPSVPMKVQLPNGKSEWRIYTSGHRYIADRTLKGLLHGGEKRHHEITVRYEDGTIIEGPYHTGPRGWDGEPAAFTPPTPESLRIQARFESGEWTKDMMQPKFETGEKTEIQRAFLGLMDQQTPGKLPELSEVAPTRTRHALEREWIDGKEVWTDMGPMNGDKSYKKEWLIEDGGKVVHGHGYGSRMFRLPNGQIWRDAEGVSWVAYERVTKQTEKVVGNKTKKFPFITEIFAKRFDPETGRTFGEEVKLMGVTDQNGVPYKAAARGRTRGYLVEGPNPILVNVEGKAFWMISFSAGDYFKDNYGTNVMFRPASEGPIGPYKPLLTKDGDLMDVARAMSKENGLTWGFARTNFFYDQNFELWATGHAIPKSMIPDDYVRSGKPKKKVFEDYARRTAIAPFRAKLVNGEPVIEADVTSSESGR